MPKGELNTLYFLKETHFSNKLKKYDLNTADLLKRQRIYSLEKIHFHFENSQDRLISTMAII